MPWLSESPRPFIFDLGPSGRDATSTSISTMSFSTPSPNPTSNLDNNNNTELKTHTLSLVISGPGISPRNPSQWSFAIHRRDQNLGTLLRVIALDTTPRIHQFDMCKGVDVRPPGSEGSFVLAEMTQAESYRARDVIVKEPAPAPASASGKGKGESGKGGDRSQEWIIEALIALESQELVPAGTTQEVVKLVGLPSREVERLVGERWVPTTG